MNAWWACGPTKLDRLVWSVESTRACCDSCRSMEALGLLRSHSLRSLLLLEELPMEGPMSKLSWAERLRQLDVNESIETNVLTDVYLSYSI
jgi:hypothetical protein